MTATADHSPQHAATDTGLFGPGSVTWRIHTDPAMWIAAFSALALQSLHPRTMWGTYQNSALFRRRTALARLFRTADFVATRTFGSTEEVREVGSRVRRIHAALTGVDERTGERFPVDDEENLLWVHCAEVYPYLLVARACGIPLTDAEADGYFAEQRRSAAVVGLAPERVPGSVAEMEEYFRRMLPELRLTTSARRGMRMWMNTPAPKRLIALRLVYPLLGVLGVGLLPGWARRLYGLPGSGITGRALEALIRWSARLTRAVMVRLPERYTGTAEQVRQVRRAKRIMREN
ncbi:uncharacterized protein (DUF2236 family) [Halopolyspora algeriensis]|uniref:Uncharacterized protein (DUF2236 family) n=1 Tax=Halopolyspora algeriensis TaxID=1500506 RepID=A0A368VCT1_9ACTN|nr:oxygenase MpaB family protein [Halopolyspora algeriensis]RCW38493.1 uncharacterized protein (DUF2236 family) [Halopolyspora algeriensis]TQM42625.1 uncharacterized protein (DUF2236 family) [Halopolyspora algeriensis]